MIKKSFILFLSCVFFLSTAVMPVSLHKCRMMKSVTVEDCSKCSGRMKNGNNEAGIKTHNGSCCSTQLIDKTVKDDFVSSKTKSNFSLSKNLTAILPVEFFDYSDDISFSYKRFSLPPPHQFNELLVLNSVFLI